MQCPECKGSVSAYNFFKEKTCPACGAELKRVPTWNQVRETAISFAEDKGYIFWSLVYIVVVIVAAFVEQLTYEGLLFDYIGAYWFRFLLCAFYSGSVADYIIKANVEVTAVRNKFIFKPPRYLRAFRNWTNFFVYLGVAVTLYLQYQFPNYISFLWVLAIVVSVLVGLGWSVMGLLLTEDDLNDKRIRYFMEEMRIGRVRYFHRVALIYLGGITLAGIAFYNLIQISGLWWFIYNSRFVYDLITFFTQYFGWMKKFSRS